MDIIDLKNIIGKKVYMQHYGVVYVAKIEHFELTDDMQIKFKVSGEINGGFPQEKLFETFEDAKKIALLDLKDKKNEIEDKINSLNKPKVRK